MRLAVGAWAVALLGGLGQGCHAFLGASASCSARGGSSFVALSGSGNMRRGSSAAGATCSNSGLRMANQEQDLDPVEKIFSFFFGDQALKDPSPMGMRRMTPELFPDQYPAVKDRWAEPVKGDTRDMALFRPALAQTLLETRQLKCVYDAGRDGWRPEAFHRGVDKKGPGVVLARTKGGAVVGGYNAKGWVGESELRPGLSAFLFTWPDGDTTKRPIKLRKIGGAGLAVVDKASTGPFFGSDGFCVPLDRASERAARSKLGSYYERMPDGTNSFFAKSEKGATQLTELKAFTGVYAKDEPIPFDDVLFFSIT